MRDDFCVFILSNRRPSNVKTYKTLKDCGYTGKLFVVVDDEDPTLGQYKERFGDAVIVYSKEHVASFTDDYDNDRDRRSPLWARNATWDLATQVGCSYFIQLDDDYGSFLYRKLGARRDDRTVKVRGYSIKSMDKVFSAMVRFIEQTQTLSLAMSQGGDHFGGCAKNLRNVRRKAMNSFLCSADRRFLWIGRLNDDVNTYVEHGKRGGLFFTYMQLQLNQEPTQAQEGGISELYKATGTYVKSFYTIITSPSSVKITMMGRDHRRHHHKINWGSTVPVIIREEHKK